MDKKRERLRISYMKKTGVNCVDIHEQVSCPTIRYTQWLEDQLIKLHETEVTDRDVDEFRNKCFKLGDAVAEFLFEIIKPKKN